MIRFACAVLLTALLLGANPLWAAPVPLPPVGGVRIELLTHDARRPLRPGDRITVTLRGSAGGSATFHIFGVVANVGMREIRTGVYQAQPALYTGTYIVRPGDAALNAAVLASLSVGGHEVMGVGNRPLTIDTRGPVVVSRQPKPGVNLANIRPNIVVQYFDGISGVHPGTVRLAVNGQNVTARASISETEVAYNPESPFRPGPVQVQVAAGDRAGNSERVEWSFTVAPPGDLLKSVTINPAAPLAPGDLLTVVASGAPGGRATFSIQGLPGAVAMRESRTAGVYFGTLAAATGISLVDAPLAVTLEKGGRRSTLAASAGVTIVGAPPPAPVVTAPGRAIVLGEEPLARIVLRGRSRPGFRILGRLTFVARSTDGDQQGTLGEFTTIAGADGGWQVALGSLVAPQGARIVATVVAFDPTGRRSPPAVQEVAQAGP
ncbi:MAG: hypothetical protein QN160_12480 [Armatimonadota bacterium]|nr:hypothetical protein [Armatimonadota bacterium]